LGARDDHSIKHKRPSDRSTAELAQARTLSGDDRPSALLASGLTTVTRFRPSVPFRGDFYRRAARGRDAGGMITTVPRASENYEIGCSTCQVGQGLAWALTTRSSAATPSTAIAEPSASSPDWPLEEEGFEPSVPEERKSASELPGGGEHSLERSPDSLLEREGCELSVTRDGQLSCFAVLPDIWRAMMRGRGQTQWFPSPSTAQLPPVSPGSFRRS
jgi:hypothetical protein